VSILKKVLLAGICAVAIAAVSSAGTYLLMLRGQRNESKEAAAVGASAETAAARTAAEKPAADEAAIKETSNTETSNTETPATETPATEAPPPDRPAESAAFAAIVKNIKQQARDAMSAAVCPDRGKAVDEVGEALKGVLSSEYAGLLNNDTFNDDAFSVAVTAYPLRNNRFINKIDYRIKNNDTDNPIEGKRFFLQYTGDNSFFSDIEYPDITNKSFQVFENTDGCYAFLVSSMNGDKTFSSNKEFSDYWARIFIPGDDGFSVGYAAIPMKVPSGYELRLVQQYGAVKAVIPNDQHIDNFDESGCVFNSSSLAFERPKGPWLSDPVDYDLPGLLLGVSDSDGNVKTLYIRKENGRIWADEYDGRIVFTRQGKLFSLKCYTDYEESRGHYTDENGKINEYPIGCIDIKKLVCAPLGAESSAVIKKTGEESEWSFRSSHDVPLYVGEDYVCYIQKSSISGGGTFGGGASVIRFDKLDDLSDFTFGDQMIPGFDSKTLADIIYGKKAEDFYQTEIRTYGGQLCPYIDFRQLSVKRNLGKWSLMLPVMEDFYHPGNGSYTNWPDSFAAFSNDVPGFLVPDNKAAELSGSWSYWNVKDLIKFPGSIAYLLQFDNVIEIGASADNAYNLGPIDAYIPVNLDEYIVSVCYADKDAQWADELSKIR